VDQAYRELPRIDGEWAWRFRLLKAQILISQSEYEEAIVLLNENLPVALASADIAVQRKIFQAIAHRSVEQFGQAENDLRDAQKITPSLRPEFSCRILLARGDLEVDEKKYSQAVGTYQQALAIARKERLAVQEADALGDLGRLATSQERYDEAIDLDQQALRLSGNLNVQGSVSTILGNMGWAYFQLGDFENSLAYYKQGQEASEKNSLRGYGAYWLTGIANVYYANHDYGHAETILNSALEIGRKLDDKETITECLNDLARIALETGRVDQAEQRIREVLKPEQQGSQHFGFLESLLLSGRIETSKHNFREAEDLFQKVIQDTNADRPLKWEAQARLAKMDDEKGLSAKAEQEYRSSIDTIETARRSVSRDDLRLSFLSGAIDFYDNYIDYLTQHRRPNDALRVAELSRARTLSEGLAAAPDSVTKLTRRDPPQQIASQLNATLLFYWLGQKHSYVWVITPAQVASFALPPAPEIDPLVRSYREALLGSPSSLAAADSEGRMLYTKLIEPAKKLIPQGSRVIVLPDSSLYGLNFETLIVPETKPHFWIEDVTLTTANSLTLLASSAAKPAPKNGSLFLVGDTVSTGTDFPPLRQAPEEMKSVRRYFPESRRKVLEGNQATPAAYLSGQPEQFAFLHFVTHGTASRARPLESAVILSREANDDSFKLYARDIVQHPLSAYLVTISACNGSGTRAYSGEGLVGLSWAFLRAGAHNVIGALWEVSDSSTPQLMDALYSGLSRGQDPATALRNAKLSLLHSDSPYKKPYYWAPFQLYAGS
jgi:CHAT domain-containing protein